ncbi:MAG: hypothetical protein KGL65_10635, partial [Rhodospirillales bacterium]|nr:hypothetical protein [Rhodospirillales bacterium]
MDPGIADPHHSSIPLLWGSKVDKAFTIIMQRRLWMPQWPRHTWRRPVDGSGHSVALGGNTCGIVKVQVSMTTKLSQQ